MPVHAPSLPVTYNPLQICYNIHFDWDDDPAPEYTEERTESNGALVSVEHLFDPADHFRIAGENVLGFGSVTVRVWMDYYLQDGTSDFTGDEFFSFEYVQTDTPAVTARAGGNYTLPHNGSVTLSASQSSGTGLTYKWDLDGDGAYDDAVGSNPVLYWTTMSSSYGRAAGNTYSVGLEVTDALNQTDTTTASVRMGSPSGGGGGGGGTPPVIYDYTYSTDETGINLQVFATGSGVSYSIAGPTYTYNTASALLPWSTLSTYEDSIYTVAFVATATNAHGATRRRCTCSSTTCRTWDSRPTGPSTLRTARRSSW